MRKTFFAPILTLLIVLAAVPALRAEVKTEEKGIVTFGGMMGRMMNMFGGRAAKEGIVSSVAVSGDRKMTLNEARGTLIDLKEEKVYDIDVRRKTYTVRTFAEIRKQMEDAEAKAREDAQKAPADEKPDTQGKEMQIDVDVKSTGETKAINGFDTHQVIITITGHEKGRKLEDSGGFVLTVDDWLTKTQPALREVSDFDRRYYEKISGTNIQVDAKQLATALAMMPGLKEAFTKANAQKLDGTPIQTTMTVEGVKSAEQMKQQQSGGGDASPTSITGALGGLMRRRAQANAEKNPSPNRSMFMTISNEVLKISTSVATADVSIPAGFKQEK